jgi:23S rRNA (pseudouridine1915-N3)-methyltransferase
MKLHLVWIGKTKDRRCSALIDDYLDRIRNFVVCEVSELKDVEGSDDAQVIEREGAKLIDAVSRDDFVVALDESGVEMSTVEFADFVKTRRDQGTKRLALVVGGFAGQSSELKNRANLLWSFSRLTMTHELARVVLTEQAYRALALLAGRRYHR